MADSLGSMISILEFCLLVTLLFTVCQYFVINKLLNKLMARNYHDYEFSKNVSKTMVQENPTTLQDALKEEKDLREDLSPVESMYGVMN